LELVEVNHARIPIAAPAKQIISDELVNGLTKSFPNFIAGTTQIINITKEMHKEGKSKKYKILFLGIKRNIMNIIIQNKNQLHSSYL
tara:strand:- start:47 stop:307 length:261 start_codon:yes stop_codon:yes gene_type:complete